jgi:hypothetical protein
MTTSRFLLVAAFLAGCAGPAPARPAPHFSRDLASGARYEARLGERAATDQEVIAAGYVERLRVGIGSPFRLMEYALRDPRLTPATRAPLVWALLDATRGGRGYQVDPRALARVASDSRELSVAQGHLDLIERAVLGGGDPRAGELAVRGAYRLAAASHAVSPTAPVLAASAAALLRDRALARRDAETLLRHAAATRKHPFAVLVEWRKARRFEVEAPPGAERAPQVEEAAAAASVLLAGRVEAVRGALPAPGTRGLSPDVARRLAKLARAQSYPTQSPIWITVERYDEQLRRAAPSGRGARAAARFVERAHTEETLVAERALLADAAASVQEVLALLAVEASVGMRAYAQEKVWFPGFSAPTARDLERTFGLRDVEFDRGVPTSWRPYYRRMLGDALADLEVVLPSLDLQGATFRFGATGKEGVALAIHDPHGRAIHLPPTSGAGAIAHEVGHDLDWQVARALYGTRAGYGTEYAVRSGRSDRFAEAVRRMPAPPEVPLRGGAELQRRYTQRPAEIFARTFDGYVAAALAARGRSNGYLTAAQDDFIGGFGLALLPGTREEAAVPFMEMMTVASPVPGRARRDFLARWGPGRVPGAFDVAGRILANAAPVPRRAARVEPGMAELLAAGAGVRRSVADVMERRDGVLASWSAARCANPLAARAARGERAVTGMADAAAEASVRGIVLASARELGLDAAPAWLRAVWIGAPPERAAPFAAAPWGSTPCVAVQP